MNGAVVVIPCFQGAATIAEAVRGARQSGLEVVVVDDGSSDGSGELAKSAGALVLTHPRNRGKGAAIATAFAWAQANGVAAVLTMDADGQHDPGEIEKLLAAHWRAPDALVVGVRSFAAADMPRRSRVGNRISTFWISRFAGVRYRDTQSGFRVYPHALFSVPLRSTRFETETELLLRAAKMKLELVEVPIATIYRHDHASHFHGLRDTLRVMRLVLGSPLWLLLFVVSCAHSSVTLLPAASDWHTMRGEHDVTLEVGGARRHLRGLIAVERPDRFRLRALGPGGLTLFDVVDVAGEVRVVESLRDANDPTMARIIASLAGDLSAAYDLLPRPSDRKVDRRGDGAVVSDGQRTVRETPSFLAIDNRALGYSVTVRVRRVDKDVTLDKALWSE